MILKILFLLFLNFLSNVFGLHKQLLTGQYNLKNINNSITIKANVPGGIYSDLMSANILEDIYYRFNDVNSRWVANETWIYSFNFDANEEHFSKKNTELVFEGLDTFSTIYLNNIKIGSSNNMFVRYVFPINQYLKKDGNNLTVVFESPIKESNKLHEEYAKNHVIPPLCVPKGYNGECHVNLIRKMQASFSWDWGPAFPSVGIWKPVYIRSYNSVVIQDVTVETIEKDDFWNVNLIVYFDIGSTNIINGQLTTQLATNIQNITIFTEINATIESQKNFEQKILISVPKGYVNLWWPNGFGSQPLYRLNLLFTSTNYNEKCIKSLKIGFRKIELVQNPTTEGLTFYFKVNDVPIFAKGSNWIPANLLPENGAKIKNIKFLLQSAKDVHMNMLRVWGGGVYESDEFYELADELGILIWQDFMFACSMYPADKIFLENVNFEIEQQVRRLQYHPSIAVWAGNNENEAALRGNWYGTSGNFSVYKKDYVTLYVDNIRNVCLSNDPSRTFLVSSPSNGLKSEEDGYIALNPFDTHYGDIHYYNYMMDGWDQNIYSKSRFCSEYGFQSMPSFDTLCSSTNVSSDLIYNSKFLKSRQHLPLGYAPMEVLIKKHINLPSSEKENYLKTFTYYSQISQAMIYKAETELYRQWRGRTESDGSGLTMGALYWQLNDVWPAPTWSSIDFKERWKMVHYFAKKFFAPVYISVHTSISKYLSIFAISDLTSIINGTLTVSVYKWTSFKPIRSENKNITILPGYSSIVSQFWLEQYLINAGCSVLNNCFLYFTLENSAGELLAPHNFVFPTALKDINGLSSPNLIAKVENLDKKSNSFNITITTDRIALFVWLETGDIHGIFSENGFLQVEKQRVIQFECEEPITTAQLQDKLTITSMLNSEHL